MTRRANELEAMKTNIDLRVYAAVAFGYELDKASSTNSTVMRGPSGDKIIVAKARDGHSIYFAIGGDPNDSGSILDFAQKRGVGSLGDVRKALRPFLGHSIELPTRAVFKHALEPITRDLVAVRARFEGMHLLEHGHRFLTKVRGIPPYLLAHPRFAKRIRTDNRGNAIFPHFNFEGLSGYEIKGATTRFSKGGAKGLWVSGININDNKLVIAEAALDALSYAALFGFDRTRFVSLAGQVSPEQVELVRAAIVKLASGDIILAFDNDEAGDQLVSLFTTIFNDAGRDDLSLVVHRPETKGLDWNDELHSGPPPPLGSTLDPG